MLNTCPATPAIYNLLMFFFTFNQIIYLQQVLQFRNDIYIISHRTSPQKRLDFTKVTLNSNIFLKLISIISLECITAQT